MTSRNSTIPRELHSTQICTKKEERIVEKEEKVIVEIKEQGKETGACRRKEDRDREVRNETDGRQRE